MQNENIKCCIKITSNNPKEQKLHMGIFVDTLWYFGKWYSCNT